MGVIMNHIFKMSAVSLIVLSLIGCGSSSDDDQDIVASADLDVQVSGLPSDVSADIDITGPDNFSTTLTGGEVIADLPAGQYTITVNNVTSDGVTYSFESEVQTVTLTAGQSLTVNIQYQAPASAQGKITGFGSVYINGVKFETEQATVVNNGESSSEDTLEVGMVVKIKGKIDGDGQTASATSIEYQANAEGPITSINLANNSFTLLGQTYLTDEFTEFDGFDFSTLNAGTWVEVSAIEDGDGNYVATRIELEEDEQEITLVGEVSELDSTAMTLSIGAQSVDYSNAEVEGELAVGAEIKVESNSAITDGVLIASEIEVESQAEVDGQVVYFDGEIESITSETEFVVDDMTVTTNSDTEFKGGTAADLAEDVEVSIKGAFVDEVFVAHQIRLDLDTQIKVEGFVESTDVDANSVVILGTTVMTDEYTQFIDVSSAKERRFRIDDILIDDKVVVKAFEVEGQLLARQLKRTKIAAEVDKDSDTISLEGKPSNIEQPEFTIKGVTVTVTEATEIERPNGYEVTSSEFFAELTADTRVEVESISQDDGTVLALEIEMKAGSDDEMDDDNEVEISGVIDSLLSSSEFTVNGHSVVTNSTTRYKDGGPDQLVIDAEIELKGYLSEDGVIVAQKIDFESDAESHREVELEGVISEFTDASNFNIGEQAISTTDTTEFENGTADDLSLDIEIEVEGEINNDGVLVASKVEFESENETSLEGTITDLISDIGFVINQQEVLFNSETEFKNSSADMIEVGATVEVEGEVDSNGVLVASKIEFAEPEETEVKGTISVFSSINNFEVDGQVIITDEFTVYKNGTADDLALEVVIEAEGYLNPNGALVATKISFE